MDRESGESLLEKVTDAPKLVATDACHEALAYIHQASIN